MTKTQFINWIKSKVGVDKYLKYTKPILKDPQQINNEYIAYSTIVIVETEAGGQDVVRYGLWFLLKADSADYKPILDPNVTNKVFIPAPGNTFADDVRAYLEGQGFFPGAIQVIVPDKAALVEYYKPAATVVDRYTDHVVYKQSGTFYNKKIQDK